MARAGRYEEEAPHFNGYAESSLPRGGCAMTFQKNKPVNTGHEFLPSASTRPLKIRMHHPSPHEKRTRAKYTYEKAANAEGYEWPRAKPPAGGPIHKQQQNPGLLPKF